MCSVVNSEPHGAAACRSARDCFVVDGDESLVPAVRSTDAAGSRRPEARLGSERRRRRALADPAATSSDVGRQREGHR